MEECAWPMAHLITQYTPSLRLRRSNTCLRDLTSPDPLIWPLDLLSAANTLEVLVAEFTVIASGHRSMGSGLSRPPSGCPIAAEAQWSGTRGWRTLPHCAASIALAGRWHPCFMQRPDGSDFSRFPQACDLCASISFTTSLHDAETWAPCSNK